MKTLAVVLICVLFAPVMFAQCHPDISPFPCDPFITNHYFAIGSGSDDIHILHHPLATPPITYAEAFQLFADDGIECLRGLGWTINWDDGVIDFVGIATTSTILNIPPEVHSIVVNEPYFCARYDLLIDMAFPCNNFLPVNIVHTLSYKVEPTAQGGMTGHIWIEPNTKCPAYPGEKGNYMYIADGPGCEVLRKEIMCDLDPKLVRVAGDFVRGDFDGDTDVDMDDFNGLAAHLQFPTFNPQPYDCRDAMDVNDDRLVNLNDLSDLSLYLTQGGAPPAAPFPACGYDPTTVSGGGWTIRCARRVGVAHESRREVEGGTGVSHTESCSPRAAGCAAG